MEPIEFKIKGYALLQKKATVVITYEDDKDKEKSQVFLPAKYIGKNVAIIVTDEIPLD